MQDAFFEMKRTFAFLFSTASLVGCVLPVNVGQDKGSSSTAGTGGTSSTTISSSASTTSGSGAPVHGLVGLRESAQNPGAGALVHLDPATGIVTEISTTTSLPTVKG